MYQRQKQESAIQGTATKPHQGNIAYLTKDPETAKIFSKTKLSKQERYQPAIRTKTSKDGKAELNQMQKP